MYLLCNLIYNTPHHMKHTFKLSFFLKRSAVRKSGKSPIIGRITVNGEKVEFSTKLETASCKWDVDAGEGKGDTHVNAL